MAITAHTVRIIALTSGTVAALPSGFVAALQRSSEQQSILQVPFLQGSVSVAVLQTSAEEQPLP